jgi:hypothetical protein
MTDPKAKTALPMNRDWDHQGVWIGPPGGDTLYIAWVDLRGSMSPAALRVRAATHRDPEERAFCQAIMAAYREALAAGVILR